MDHQIPNVKCPLCEGLGELSPSAVTEQFSNPELRQRLEARVAEIAASIAPVAVGAVGAQPKNRVLNFEKETHTWNPTASVWRRSPKE